MWEDERIRNPASAKAPAGECVILRCGRFGLAPLGHAQVRPAASFLAASARPLPRRRGAVVRWERGCGGSRRIFPRASIHLPSQQQQRSSSRRAAAQQRPEPGKGCALRSPARFAAPRAPCSGRVNPLCVFCRASASKLPLFLPGSGACADCVKPFPVPSSCHLKTQLIKVRCIIKRRPRQG